MVDNLITYFNGDSLAAQIFLDKYALKNEKDMLLETHPNEMFMRLAKEFESIEKTLSKPKLRKLSFYGKQRFSSKKDVLYFYKLFDNFKKILPGGSILSNLGNNSLGSTSNCYYLDLEEDSTEAIHKLNAQMSSIYKYRGGVGIDISKLRPRGAFVANGAKTSTGAVSFMDLFSVNTTTIAQNSRRGALMITIDIDHPDSPEFITSKQDLTKITGANISLKFNKEFLAYANANLNYILQWSADGTKLSQKEAQTLFFDADATLEFKDNTLYFIGNRYLKRIKAKEIYELFIEANHSSAEPGMLLWDNILDYSLSSYYPEYKEKGTNPCQPEWATVLTPTGLRTFKDINIGDSIWSSEGWTTVVNKQYSGIKDVYNYKTTSGTFSGTEQHNIISQGKKIEAKDAETIDVLAGTVYPISKLNMHDIMDGLVLGDGSVHKASNNLIFLCIGQDDGDYFKSEIKPLIYKHRPGIKSYAYEINTTIVKKELPHTYKRRIPDRFLKGDSTKVRGFLRGLYSANGSVINKRISFKTASPYIRDEVQLLLSSIGIRSYYTTNKSKTTNFSNGTYDCKESYDINITTDREIFYHHIGFIQHYKMNLLEDTLDNIQPKDKTANIINIDLISTEPVYNITVDNTSHTYWTGGLNVANCGEIPLGDKDACRLFALNLKEININEELYQLAYEQVILADYLIDLEGLRINKILQKINPKTSPIEYNLWKDIKQTAANARRIGCGLTGLFDAIVKYINKYGLQNPNLYTNILNYVETIMDIKLQAELDASIDLAIIRKGTFKGYTKKETSAFIDFIKDNYPEAYARMRKYGRRNVSLSTVAPTGSISILAGCSSGIEPVFAPYYIRRKKLTASATKVDHTDVDGETFTNHVVVHHGLAQWAAQFLQIKELTEDNVQEVYKQSPYYGLSSAELPLEFRINLQAMVQKYTTHSISSTLNLPSSTTIEAIKDIYNLATIKNLKGCTVYREGSRNGILITNTNNEIFPQHDAPKRPKELLGEAYAMKARGIDYAVIVGLLDNKPYEIFAAEMPPVFIPQTGKLIKVKKGVYKWIGENGDILETINNLSDNSAERTITLQLSMLLRTGAKIPYVIKTIKKSDTTIVSFNSAIARVLTKYLPKAIVTDSCPDCGAKLIREAGCVKCTECTYSLCS